MSLERIDNINESQSKDMGDTEKEYYFVSYSYRTNKGEDGVGNSIGLEINSGYKGLDKLKIDTLTETIKKDCNYEIVIIINIIPILSRGLDEL